MFRPHRLIANKALIGYVLCALILVDIMLTAFYRHREEKPRHFVQSLMDNDYSFKKYFGGSKHGREQDAAIVNPTSNDMTVILQDKRLTANSGDFKWQLRVIKNQPDFYLVAPVHADLWQIVCSVEHRYFRLMEWILRSYREDPARDSPLLMIDVGANHGIFSLSAGVSGAQVIGLELQPHVRSSMAMSVRLNQVEDRTRLLSLGALDKFNEFPMSNDVFKNPGQVTLDVRKDSPGSGLMARTVRLDALPRYDLLFSTNNILVSPEDIGHGYSEAFQRAQDAQRDGADPLTLMPDDLSLRQPVHFLKIDVEGFEMEVIDSAAKLMDLQLVENIIAEFGPVGVWTNSKLDLATTRTNWKKGLKKMIRHYGFDIRILDGPGFRALVDLMQRERVNIDPESPSGKVKINRLFARDFFGNTFQPGDAFSEKMKAAQYHISDYVDLPFEFIDTFLDQNDNIAQLYLWFTRRESPMVQNFFSE